MLAASLWAATPPAVADAGRDSGAFGALGRTALSAIVAVTGTKEALSALGDSMAMEKARERVEAQARRAAEAPPPAAPKPIPGDPSSMPPASAGTNGTPIQRHGAAAGRLFAHVPAGGGESTSILLTGIALAPPDAPEAVQGAIDAANTIVGRPYIWGGGHRSFYSNGYDCSGSVSFALFGGGLIPRPLTSTELESWGAPGPGRWITVYANGGHAFAEIAGLRWDTVGDARGTGPRWHLAPTSTAGFVARHPPGY
jgi:cell wall-associated NlpC family hydrolase